jgi:hypothetical protein
LARSQLGEQMRFSAVALAVVGSICVWSSVAAAQEAKSTREREALRPNDANRTVQADLLSVFEPVKKIERGMFIQLHGVGLTTKAFGTEYNGLCRRDDVTLWYAPTRRHGALEDAPVQPYSVEARAWFHFLSLPRKEPRTNDDATAVWSDPCERAGRDEKANWFAAHDAQAAIQGTLVLEAALEAVRTGALKAAPCPTVFDKNSSCEDAILAGGDIHQLDNIEACFSKAGTVCFKAGFGNSTELTVTARSIGEALAPGEVMSIAIRDFVVVT